MSDNLDAILSGLDDAVEKPKATTAPRKPRKRTAPSTAPKPASKKTVGTSDQRGKRDDENTTQVNANIDKELKASLFYYLKVKPAKETTTLQDLIEKLLADWVDKQGGIIAPPKKKR